jgi:aldose 1-epimerase
MVNSSFPSFHSERLLIEYPGTFALKQTQGCNNSASHPQVVNKYGCVVMEVEDWIDGINNPEWGRDSKQIFGPGDGPYVLEATYNFSLNASVVGGGNGTAS